jgi:DNA-binding MarR family transcriptional regulator
MTRPGARLLADHWLLDTTPARIGRAGICPDSGRRTRPGQMDLMVMDNVRSLRNQGWAWFDYAVLDTHGPKIKAAGIAVYMVLARHAGNETQQAFPALQSIAAKTGMSDRQVKRVLKTLADEGLISIEPQHDADGRQLSNLYTLLPIMSYRGDTQSPSGGTHSPGEGDTQSPKQDSGNNTHRNKRETVAPAPVAVDIPRNSPVVPSRDMAPGTAVNRRPDAPVLRAVPKFAETAEFQQTLTALLDIWPLRDGAGPNPKLTEKALVLVAPSEYPAVLAGARRVAGGKDAREGVVKNLHTWLADEDWRRYQVGARPAGGAVYANGKRA